MAVVKKVIRKRWRLSDSCYAVYDESGLSIQSEDDQPLMTDSLDKGETRRLFVGLKGIYKD